MIYSITFVWYNVEKEITCACIKENSGELIEGKRVTKKGILKPETICVGSVWKKRVMIVFCKQHFMNLKETTQV